MAKMMRNYGTWTFSLDALNFQTNLNGHHCSSLSYPSKWSFPKVGGCPAPLLSKLKMTNTLEDFGGPALSLGRHWNAGLIRNHQVGDIHPAISLPPNIEDIEYHLQTMLSIGFYSFLAIWAGKDNIHQNG